MMIFRSNNQEDIDFAREHGVWQSNVKARGLEIGEPIALLLTGTKDPIIVGVATTEMYEDAPYAWPGGKQEYTNTVKFTPIDFVGQWSNKKI